MNIVNYKKAIFPLFGLVLILGSCLKEESKSLPPAPPAAVYFADIDPGVGLAGNIAVEKAGNEENISEYVLWWGKSAGHPYPGLGKIAAAPKTGERLITVGLPKEVPAQARYILAAGRNKDGDSPARSVFIMRSSGATLEARYLENRNTGDVGIGDARISDLTVSSLNNVYATGSAVGLIGDLSKNESAPGRNVFTARFDDLLNPPVWLSHKPAENDNAEYHGDGVAVDGAGDVYVYGRTNGAMFPAGDTTDGPRPSNQLGDFDFFWFGYEANGPGVPSGYSEKTRTLCYPNPDGGKKCGERVAGTRFGTSGKEHLPTRGDYLVMSGGVLYMAGNYEVDDYNDIIIGLYDTQDNVFYQRTLGSGRYGLNGGYVSEEKNDYVYDMAADDSGAIYIVGKTLGNLGLDPSDDSPYKNGNAFLMKFPLAEALLNPLCEDSTYDAEMKTREDGSFFFKDNRACDSRDDIQLRVEANKLALPLDDRNYHWLCYKNGVPYAGDPSQCVKDATNDAATQYSYEKRKIGWNRHLGTDGEDIAAAVAVDGAGDVYVAGHTTGELATNPDGPDISDAPDLFIFKIAEYTDAQGKRKTRYVWKKQTSLPGFEKLADMATDGENNVYLLISALGSVFDKNRGGRDVVLIKYSPGGERIWGKQLGTEFEDFPTALALDEDNNIYIGGFRTHALSSSSASSFIIKYEAEKIE